jgi:hypothetical protein
MAVWLFVIEAARSLLGDKPVSGHAHCFQGLLKFYPYSLESKVSPTHFGSPVASLTEINPKVGGPEIFNVENAWFVTEKFCSRPLFGRNLSTRQQGGMLDPFASKFHLILKSGRLNGAIVGLGKNYAIFSHISCRNAVPTIA